MENAAATELFAKAEDIRKAAKPEDRMTPARAYREAMRQNPELAAAALRPGETVPVRKAELEVRLGQHAIEIRKASGEELSASQAYREAMRQHPDLAAELSRLSRAVDTSG